MKKHLIILLCLSVKSVMTLEAQSNKFVTAMEFNVSILDTAKALSTYQTLANTFERIANVEKAQWLPYYYAAYCLVKQSYITDKKNAIDDIADHAEILTLKADSLNPNNSEIFVLIAMTNACRISVNPMTRGKKYGTISNIYLEKAEKADTSNPRVYLQRGMSLFYTPKMFGGGKDKAKVQFKEAIDKFVTFNTEPIYNPHWGKKEAAEMLNRCNDK